MEALLIKILAAALALSQVMVDPEAAKTAFDRDRDQQQVADLLQAGCTHMVKAFDVENVNLDDLVETAMSDPEPLAGGDKQFRGINFEDLHSAYRQFCKKEPVEHSTIDIGKVIDFYNNATVDLPDPGKLKGMKLPGESAVLDIKGDRFAEMFQEQGRRVWIPLLEVPEHVRNAFIAAEDGRFYQHKGVDERGLIRAFINNLAQSGHLEGGSTITQQLVKNLLVGDDRSYERKIREMIVTTRAESILSKDEILELYLNSIYLGRGSWGIELAARNYFGKSARELTLEEAALLAGLTKGPATFSPDRQPARARERLSYVLARMQEEGMTDGAGTAQPNRAELPRLIPYQHPRRDIGFNFMDDVTREVRQMAGINSLTVDSYTIHSTINPQLQRALEEALQEGLFQYERNAGRSELRTAEANLGQAVVRIQGKAGVDKRPSWQQALMDAHLPLYDVHWTPAIVVEKPGSNRGQGWRVGLMDGRIVPLSVEPVKTPHKPEMYDVVFVHLVDGEKKSSAKAELRVRPEVQGAALVMENRTGRILAMAGGFSYPLSQLNRATQAARQPGSAIKPLTYLAALGSGLQPNTLVSDGAITLRPIGLRHARERDYWSPKNYDGRGGGTLTLRQALEHSRNRATAHLLKGGIEDNPEDSLNRICELAAEARIYRECGRFYPMVLGAQPVRPVDLAAFYAAIANEGARPTPYVVDSIERDGRILFHREPGLATIDSVDRAAFYQLKSMLQGVVARGTASSITALSPYVAGKTGTSEDENDAWFAGFTNDVTVVVWLGYDNADGQRRTLGSGSTGGTVSVPIFERIIQAVWRDVRPRTTLAPPSPEAMQQLSCKSADVESGRRRKRGEENSLEECLRTDGRGKVVDTRHRLVAHKNESDSEDRGKPVVTRQDRDGQFVRRGDDSDEPFGRRRFDLFRDLFGDP
jgi:penicillin-binding protein 1A